MALSGKLHVCGPVWQSGQGSCRMADANRDITGPVRNLEAPRTTGVKEGKSYCFPRETALPVHATPCAVIVGSGILGSAEADFAAAPCVKTEMCSNGPLLFCRV